MNTKCSLCPMFNNGNCKYKNKDVNENNVCAFGVVARLLRAIQFYRTGNIDVRAYAKKAITDCIEDIIIGGGLGINMPKINYNGNFEGIVEIQPSKYDGLFRDAEAIFQGKFIKQNII